MLTYSSTKMSHKGGHDSESAFVGSWLTDTYRYGPTLYLPELLAINASVPRIGTVQDQTAVGRGQGQFFAVDRCEFR